MSAAAAEAVSCFRQRRLGSHGMQEKDVPGFALVVSLLKGHNTLMPACASRLPFTLHYAMTAGCYSLGHAA
ncbi:hypothetical protein RvY_13235 [Ramazzottius varieornatus]|uniref:Uncharacterized protein n=1 Tax=Ramazzottius varieornatus TaxID=947166 RepID=A0A1D1VUP6_RAMVA|nr:hypothetical protein RvY_13235 [Ramazzottius varieornatus]